MLLKNGVEPSESKMEVVIKRSLAQVKSLTELLENAYGIAFTEGYLLHSRENDVYKLIADTRSYILKVYPKGSMPETKLRFIDSNVSRVYNDHYIVRTKTGRLSKSISYPEGDRSAVLYKFIESTDESDKHIPFRDYGEEVARLHTVDVEISKPEDIPYAKFENLIVDVTLSHQSKYKLLELLSFIERFPKNKLNNLELGLCHGDCHIDNVVKTRNGVQLIDLDFMSVNYLVTDLVSVIWAYHYGMGVTDNDLEDFLTGYSIRKSLPKLYGETLSFFVMKKEMLYLISYLKRQALIGESFVNSVLVISRLLKLYEFSKTRESSRCLKLITSQV